METRYDNAVKSRLLDLALHSALCTFTEADMGSELTEKSKEPGERTVKSNKPMQQAGKTLKKPFHKPFWIVQPTFIRENDENISV